MLDAYLDSLLGEEQELLPTGEEQGEALAPADLSGDVVTILPYSLLDAYLDRLLGEEQELLQSGEEQGEALAPADLSGDVVRTLPYSLP